MARTKGASIRFCHLPHSDDGKTGLDDYIGQGHTKEDLYALGARTCPSCQSLSCLKTMRKCRKRRSHGHTP